MAVPMRTIVNANGRKGRVAATYPPLVAGELKLAPKERRAQAEDPDQMPAKSASTEAWRSYAVRNGLTSDEAEALTRDELVAQFTKE